MTISAHFRNADYAATRATIVFAVLASRDLWCPVSASRPPHCWTTFPFTGTATFRESIFPGYVPILSRRLRLMPPTNTNFPPKVPRTSSPNPTTWIRSQQPTFPCSQLAFPGTAFPPTVPRTSSPVLLSPIYILRPQFPRSRPKIAPQVRTDVTLRTL